MKMSHLRKLGGLLFAACCLTAPIWAQAKTSFDVRAYGATGDGVTLDTAAINRAIAAAAAAGGGTVEFPAGTYLSFSIHLASNVALYLDAGCTIVAAEPPSDLSTGYDAPEPNPAAERYVDFGHAHWHNSLIWGEGLHDIAITGPGKIFGRGLSRGRGHEPFLRDELQEERRAKISAPRALKPFDHSAGEGPFGYPGEGGLDAGIGNKAIALKNCRNVIFRDFTIYHGGHFAILATGVDNWTCDNLKIDTNRDGIDLDCCQNVRITNCTVNSPFDDAICPKSSFALGYVRPTENVTIANCQVSGYDEGTLLDGTRTRHGPHRADPTGRIKLGTESNGAFRNITITNCVFDYSRGLALEAVDGAVIEDVTISNLTMRDIGNAPIFIRLGARLRGPDGAEIGAVRRVKISNVVAHNVAAPSGVLIAGLPGHPVEDLVLDNVFIDYAGGGTKAQGERVVPEYEREYPEPWRFGTMPAWGVWARHVQNLGLRGIELRTAEPDERPALMLEDVAGASLDFVRARATAGASTLVLTNVSELEVHRSAGLPETRETGTIANARW
jgi:polygalacturonase